ncbi:BrxA/BrxB family bacilliredoxin [Anaerobacillus isosaccharinicus]|uniref:BrxA/BrxB family bacilliredoxin n=1 Tax=Anaerobacillus isosaccharinicus TaxID=1532552 RepID=A0A1S2MEF8_9BACI|nr:BrxA/BrxB family bacilliredoxin [Anaerobacillus isosaccharinicus]MBA5585653.1 BrxA/BrxB family bacilliredoxin [Anaerobacillus isosaccharinicus]QOY36039.1 BrxA/BrxB family bacilliredoxin [Anaerobacillus isosaccharinicus]
MEFSFYNDVINGARKEMVDAGYQELTTPEEVDAVLGKKGTSLVYINSVCGCAGGIARPSAAYMANYEKKPDNFVTVFAGQDKEATDRARTYFKGFAPSSPSFAIVKDGEIKAMIERHEIEGHEPVQVVQKLEKYFDEFM